MPIFWFAHLSAVHGQGCVVGLWAGTLAHVCKLGCCAVHCCAVQRSAVQCGAVQCCAAEEGGGGGKGRHHGPLQAGPRAQHIGT